MAISWQIHPPSFKAHRPHCQPMLETCLKQIQILLGNLACTQEARDNHDNVSSSRKKRELALLISLLTDWWGTTDATVSRNFTPFLDFLRASLSFKPVHSEMLWKAKWCKIQEAKLSSHSTNFLSRSREISIKLTKIKSRSTDFLSRSRHILIKLNNKNYHIQQISIQRLESIVSSSRNELSFLSTKRFSQFSRIIQHRH